MSVSAFVIGTYGLLMSYLMIWQARYDWHTNPTTQKLAIVYAAIFGLAGLVGFWKAFHADK